MTVTLEPDKANLKEYHYRPNLTVDMKVHELRTDKEKFEKLEMGGWLILSVLALMIHIQALLVVLSYF
jgi:hypothetical protein